MARVLFLTHVLPYPLNSGARIRAYYVLQQLARAHEVTLVSFVREDDRPEHVAHLETLCHAVHPVRMRRSPLRDARALLKGGATGMPIIIIRDEIAAMHATLRRLVRETPFDVVHADQTSMAQYGLYAGEQLFRARSNGRPRVILDAHNALYRIPERLARREANPLKRLLYRREARALLRYELGLCRSFDHVVFVTGVDREALVENGLRGTEDRSNLQSSVIPICIDPTDKPLVERVSHPRAITHLGTMFWPPNVEGVLWFARHVFPQVLERVPDARFVVIGKDPPPEVRDLPAQVRNVEVTGYVADPRPYLAETAAFVVPLHAAGGMRVKILDAWCWGMPMLSTTIGAEGIEVRDGENILVEDGVEDFASATLRILEEPELGERLRRSGREWVEQRYDWRRVYSRWEDVYRVEELNF